MLYQISESVALCLKVWPITELIWIIGNHYWYGQLDNSKKEGASVHNASSTHMQTIDKTFKELWFLK